MRFIVLDLDDTLLDSSKNVSKETIEELRHLRNDLGVKIIVATGRDRATLIPLLKRIKLLEELDLAVMNNGVESWFPEENYWIKREMVSVEQIKEITERYSGLPDVTVAFHNAPDFYATKDTPKVRAIMKSNGRKKLKNPLTDHEYSECPRVMLLCDKGQADKVYVATADHAPKGLKLYRSEKTICEFLNKNVSKFNAVKEYIESMGDKVKEACAFGDSGNDISLLKNCYGIAMPNGSADAKAAADEVCRYSSDEGGVLDWLREYEYMFSHQ